MSDSEDPIDPIDEGGDDLFGDEPDEIEETVASPKERVLEDDDLASDPGADTYGRYRDDDDVQGRDQDEVRERIIVDVTAYRHSVPKPSDGALRALRVPKFIRFQPEEYRPDTFEPSELDIANAKDEHPQHVARFRKDASTGRLHSNSNVLRWSDGSVTISIGGEQYEIQKKPLAPPANKPYNELHDVHYYAAAAELSSNMLMTVGHVTEQFNVRPNKEVGDNALNLLADRMAQASKAAHNSEMIIRTTVDPELQKKKAEQLEKERMKAQRRRENAQARQDGLGRPGRGGLTVGGLEGPGSGVGRKRGAAGTKPKRRRPEYDSDDDLPQGVGRQEKYDLDDGFLVGSDEEEEMESGVEEDDDDGILDDEEEAPRRKRQRTVEPEDEDASGDEGSPAPEHSRRGRRHNIIEDDDD